MGGVAFVYRESWGIAREEIEDIWGCFVPVFLANIRANGGMLRLEHKKPLEGRFIVVLTAFLWIGREGLKRGVFWGK